MLLFYVYGCLLVFVSVHHMSAWYSWRPEKHVRPSGTRVQMVMSCYVDASIQIWSLGKAASTVNRQATISSAPAVKF